MSRAGGSVGATIGRMDGIEVPELGGDRLPAVRIAQDRLGGQPVMIVACEPDADAMAAIRTALEGLDVELVECVDGARALLEVGRRNADLLLLAATLPVLDAAVLVRTLRQVDRLPVLLGVAESDGDNAAHALAAGATRVLPRPYDPDQLRRAIAAAVGAASMRPGRLTRGALVIDPLSYTVTLHGRRIEMPARQFEVLIYLARHSDRAVSIEELRDAIWGSEQLSVQRKSVTGTVMRLRSRLGDDGDGGPLIATVRGHGYRLMALDRPAV